MATRQMKKCSSKLKSALDITLTSAIKVYLIFCWGGVISTNLRIKKEAPADTLEGIGNFDHSVTFWSLN